MEITGKIEKFLESKSGVAKSTGNEWKSQEFIISNNEGYNQEKQVFCFQVFGADKVENLNKFNKVGDEVKVSFNINTNEWQGKYYTSLQSWRIDKAENQSTGGVESTLDKQQPVASTMPVDTGAENDLPF